MFGENPVRKQDRGDGAELWIQELFYTLQGEGPFAGCPALFVRLGGCNLKCYWCDTDFESSAWRPSLDELERCIDAAMPPGVDLVVLTGGEPFRQNIRPLIERQLARGRRVQIETNGTLWLDLPADPALSIVCSPKTKNLHAGLVPRVTAYKYVLADGEIDSADGLPLASTQARTLATRIFRPPADAMIYVMPRDDGDEPADRRNRAACRDVALRHGYRLSLQLHKILDLR